MANDLHFVFMTINPSIFKAYDIRGLYPKDINEENIVEITKSIYTFLTRDLGKKRLEVVLGRDARLSSPSLSQVVKNTLVKMGATVVDIGVSSTPTVYFATLHHKYDAGLQISASHNPKEYNGIKFVKRSDAGFVKISKIYGMDQVKKICLAKDFAKPLADGKTIDMKNALDEEIKFAFTRVGYKPTKKFKIVVDAANSMGAVMFERLFQNLPHNLVKMNFELDGNFPAHQPDPLQFKLLKSLQEKVLEEHADFGIAPDGDGDRVFFIDEKGKIIPATLISCLIAKEILAKKKNQTILVDVRYTKNVRNICEKYGGKLSFCPVGHALITDQLNKEGAIFAGESSGHYYFMENGGAESSLRVVLHILDVLSRKNKPLSQVVKELQTAFESGEYNFLLKEGLTSAQIVDEIKKTYSDAKFLTIDGISVYYPSWNFNIRASNTEPLLRLNVEADSQKLTAEKLNELKEKIIKKGAVLKE